MLGIPLGVGVLALRISWPIEGEAVATSQSPEVDIADRGARLRATYWRRIPSFWRAITKIILLVNATCLGHGEYVI
jgi:hypothetical protein